jgi:hypothetical protein
MAFERKPFFLVARVSRKIGKWFADVRHNFFLVRSATIPKKLDKGADPVALHGIGEQIHADPMRTGHQVVKDRGGDWD